MSASEDIRNLLRRQKDIEAFRSMIDEGVSSGPSRPAADVLAELRGMIDRA